MNNVEGLANDLKKRKRALRVMVEAWKKELAAIVGDQLNPSIDDTILGSIYDKTLDKLDREMLGDLGLTDKAIIQAYMKERLGKRLEKYKAYNKYKAGKKPKESPITFEAYLQHKEALDYHFNVGMHELTKTYGLTKKELTPSLSEYLKEQYLKKTKKWKGKTENELEDQLAERLSEFNKEAEEAVLEAEENMIRLKAKQNSPRKLTLEDRTELRKSELVIKNYRKQQMKENYIDEHLYCQYVEKIENREYKAFKQYKVSIESKTPKESKVSEGTKAPIKSRGKQSKSPLSFIISCFGKKPLQQNIIFGLLDRISAEDTHLDSYFEEEKITKVQRFIDLFTHKSTRKKDHEAYKNDVLVSEVYEKFKKQTKDKQKATLNHLKEEGHIKAYSGRKKDKASKSGKRLRKS